MSEMEYYTGTVEEVYTHLDSVEHVLERLYRVGMIDYKFVEEWKEDGRLDASSGFAISGEKVYSLADLHRVDKRDNTSEEIGDGIFRVNITNYNRDESLEEVFDGLVK